jgi:uncharacterized protein (TIGR02996 family)
MGTSEKATCALRESHWRWPNESAEPEDRATHSGFPPPNLPSGVQDNAALRRAVIDHPDDDEPRAAYAAWMAAQDHEFARTVAAFMSAQLRVAQAFRNNRRVDVGSLRSWRGDTRFVSNPEFRAGDSLRPWYLGELSALMSLGLVGWPQVYRGFIERVGVRARRLLQIGEELFSLAPIRHLVIIGVPEVVDQLAASPLLGRIRSLSLPRYRDEDELTDDTLERLVASPHLGQLAHLRVVHQPRLTPRAFAHVVTRRTLPLLSSFEVYSPLWDLYQAAAFDPRGRSERIIAYDTPIGVMREKDWITDLERDLGYVPCLHQEDYYGRDFPDLEAIVEHPIARDPRIMARRGLSPSGLPVLEVALR